MGNRLEFTTALDGSGFAKGIRDMERLAGISGGRMSGALAGGLMSHGGPGGGMSGVMRESLVIIREFGRGNYTRIPGSATLLAQYLGGLSKLMKDNVTPAKELAAALGKEAAESMRAADAAEKKATALLAARNATKTAAEQSLLAASAASSNLTAQGVLITTLEAKVAAQTASINSGKLLTGVAKEQYYADINELLAAKANVAGLNWKTEVAWGCFQAESADAEATLKAALAADAEAISASADAKALEKKAIAADAAAAAAKNSISAFGWIAIGAIAIAVPLYFLWKHLERVAIAEKNAAALTDITSRSFEYHAKALRSAAEAAQDYADWKKDLSESGKGSKDEIDEELRVMREKAKLQQQLAEAEGATKVRLAQLEASAQQKELDYLNSATEKLKEKLALQQSAADAAEARASGFSTGASADSQEALDAANNKVEESAKVVEAIKKYMADHPEIVTHTGSGSVIGGLSPIQGVGSDSRAITGSDVVTAMVGEKPYKMSLNAAMAAYQKDADETTRLAALKKEISDTLRKSKMLTEQETARLNRLQSEADKISDDLGLNQLRGSAAAAEDAKKSLGKGLPGGDSLVRVGNFLGTARSGIENLAAEHVKIAREQLGHLRSIDGKMGHSIFSGT